MVTDGSKNAILSGVVSGIIAFAGIGLLARNISETQEQNRAISQDNSIAIRNQSAILQGVMATINAHQETIIARQEMILARLDGVNARQLELRVQCRK